MAGLPSRYLLALMGFETELHRGNNRLAVGVRGQRHLRGVIYLSAILQLAACSSVETVAPYDRGYLAEDGMQWEENSRNAKLKGHVYTSKEASSGGAGSAGGGCGCN